MPALAVRRLAQTPELARVHQANPEIWPFLLASTAPAGQLGRWSLLLHQEGEQIECRDANGTAAFLPRLRAATAASTFPGPSAPGLPFAGGWFVYLGYELAGEIEPRLHLPAAPDGLPVAYAARCPGALLLDHQLNQAWLVAESEPLLDKLGKILHDTPSLPAAAASLPGLEITADPGEIFMAGVRRIREWILAGDVFQVNLSRGWQARSSEALDAVDLYRALARANPAPFAGLARLPGATVISSSPERLAEIRGNWVQTRPIAGTRPRGACPALDQGLSSELITHPKERAEHIMLIDLERNDLGRVCLSGSVEVDELMVVESYAHVHHIVSNVRGRLRPDLGPVDVIAAVFPGGTITGCPKVRCMEIIAELEGHGRGFYTGAMGYLGLDGSLDLNILIRSMVVAEDRLSFRTGAGIVADSDPAAELAETEAKARGLLKALGAA
ncbi:MAG: aminodeoxychorismate synthase component I [Wenzhouxiangella sp.]